MSRFDRTKFKTVDQLMEWVISNTTHTPLNPYVYIEFEDYVQIKDILKSKENNPSKHDIGIIREINSQYTPIEDGSDWHILSTDILKLYRDRK